MYLAAQFAAFAQSGLNLMDYTLQFSRLAVRSSYDDEILKNYYHQVDLSDTQGLDWREAILQYLESVYPRSVPQPDPEHSPPSPLTMEVTTPEPPADGELPPAPKTEPVMTAPTNTPEPKYQHESD